MTDDQFNKLWIALNDLQSAGVYTVIFRKTEEDRIKKAISERYGNRHDGKIFLRNIELIFL